ncbi:MAG: nucleoside triphosphate pyrophosphohydrolase [SAR202 cluster bacterium]|nr:nucleoside triphosphate pyrophosphohydrolase [SAR202 cluster bacterium]
MRTVSRPDKQDDQFPPTFEGLAQVIAFLRSPAGCPWDRQQTHASLRSSLIEECYEVLAALDSGDTKGLVEELGDLLLQAVFHCQIARENQEFEMKEVFQGIVQKLLRRHPHVFEAQSQLSPSEVEEQWERLKQKEKAGQLPFASVPTAMPALAFAQAISQRAGRSGFDWPNLDGVKEKLREEFEELEKATGTEEIEHEIGDVLFTMVNVARWHGVDSESALRKASQRFRTRYTSMQEASSEKGVVFQTLPRGKKETLWEEAKARLAQQGEGRGVSCPP